MTNLLWAADAGHGGGVPPVVEPAAADGVFSLLWLIIGLPALGAAVLLLLGRRTDRWGHYLGTATVAGSFVISLIAFFALLGRDEIRHHNHHGFLAVFGHIKRAGSRGGNIALVNGHDGDIQSDGHGLLVNIEGSSTAGWGVADDDHHGNPGKLRFG